MKADHIILGVHVTNRLKRASEVQQVFTEYGCHIKTRLGLHELAEDAATGEGVVLLELLGGAAVRDGMVAKLSAIEGIEVREMVFAHE